MNEKKLIILVIVITVIIIFGGVFVLGSTTNNTPKAGASKDAKAYTLEPTSFDLGNVPINGGNVTKTFTIKNAGSGVLKVFNVKTSCHCTKARVTIAEEDSPDFGMDSISSWVGEVPAGDKAKLTAIFDPAFHGVQGIGPINRFVLIETNDSRNSKLTFTLTGTVIK
ncbi:MAG: hypothetical protein A3B44_00375 [Candidatus Levybacteria bacterium RIFCSPLOWO2_01_FULL_38_21]|nr:MAG: hypothetical protein A3B44_00375 [Candidatus Levybacteria bacterium RIFCSPLOWO2_01_FULL_38_21]